MLSLFSGVGGLDLGLERAGFHLLGSIEIDEVARRSLKANRGDAWPHLPPHDIAALSRDLQPSDLGLKPGELSLIAGAPPCQPYSKAAQWSRSGRGGLGDSRGLLLHDVIELVAKFQPKIVVLENVSGFVSGTTSVLPAIEASLDELAIESGHRYKLSHSVLDANAYGVAQSRRRAIVILSRIGDIPWPIPMAAEDRPVAWDAIGGLVDSESHELAAGGKYGDLLPSIPEGCNYQWHTDRGEGAPLFGYRTRYWSFLLKLAKNEPAWTLAAQPGPSTGPFHWTSRPLTIQEMLLLQSFPSEWRVEGTRREQVRQVGNATPPALAERIGICLLQALGHSTTEPTLGHVRFGDIPAPEPVQSVAGRYEKLIGSHDPHPGAGLGPSPRPINGNA
jgi:DNA (cytosine-5)-methyltransferase 1